MKTIEEAAKEIVRIKDGSTISPLYNGFKSGVEFAQRWVPVEEELPEFTTLNKHNAVNVKFSTITGDVRECTATLEQISQHCFENSPMHNRWFVYPSSGSELKTVISWRPIELK